MCREFVKWQVEAASERQFPGPFPFRSTDMKNGG